MNRVMPDVSARLLLFPTLLVPSEYKALASPRWALAWGDLPQ